MMTLDALTTFLGWCTVINIVVLIIIVITITMFKNPVIRLHSKMFGVNPDDLPLIYFNFIGNYKLVVYVLNLVPYIALKVMA